LIRQLRMRSNYVSMTRQSFAQRTVHVSVELEWS